MAIGQKIGDAQSVRVNVANTVPVIKGNFYLFQNWFGMAFSQKGVTTNAADVILNIEQCEYATSQITLADAFAKGDPVYWVVATSLLSTVSNAGANRLVGRVTVAKDAANIIYFKLGPQ